jgi:pyruvate ferredoxin oxidoreductase gamma subunit
MAARPRERRIAAMLQVRIHGRGGQGVVTAAELLSLAAFDEGLHAQAFPTFGSERMGAPVTSFCRIDDKPIRAREPIAEPDALIVQDPTLLHQVAVFSGLKPDGCVLINTERDVAELGIDELAQRVVTVPATQLAREHLGRPLPNAVLLGAFAALTGAVSLEALSKAIGEKFSGRLAEGNIRGAEAAFAAVQAREEATRA